MQQTGYTDALTINTTISTRNECMRLCRQLSKIRLTIGWRDDCVSIRGTESVIRGMSSWTSYKEQTMSIRIMAQGDYYLNSLRIKQWQHCPNLQGDATTCTTEVPRAYHLWRTNDLTTPWTVEWDQTVVWTHCMYERIAYTCIPISLNARTLHAEACVGIRISSQILGIPGRTVFVPSTRLLLNADLLEI